MIHAGVLAFLIFPGLLLLWQRRGGFAGSPWPAAVAATLFGAAQVREALANIREPREWDYACFWLYAHVARLHENLYDPHVFQAVALPFRVDRGFTQAVLDVGFPYPPPSIALFLPLGAFGDVAHGLAFWYVAQVVAFAIAALALQRAFFPRDGARGFALVAALVLLLPAVSTNTSQAQTNVFLLALVALAFLHRDKSWGSVWYVLAGWVKPYAFALVLHDLAAVSMRRLAAGSVRRLATAVVAIGVSLVASLGLVGPRTFATYFQSNPSLREPSSAFIESSNQSLLATILRTTHAALGAHLSLLHAPLFLAFAALLVTLSTVLCARYRERSDLCFSLTLLLGLLVYPGTLESYGTIAILPMLVLWSRRSALPLGKAGVAALAGTVVVLQGPLHAGFFANALLWLCSAFALTALRPDSETKSGPERARRSEPLSFTESN